MNLLPVQRASQLDAAGPHTHWLVEDLWSEQAVGILGGEPKCCKSFLALDIAVSVASGAACLRRFSVQRTGKVLLFPAEDSLAVVRQRLEGICKAAQVCFELSGLRSATVCSALAELSQRGLVSRDGRGYQLRAPSDSQDVSLSRPIDPQGNGNGKHPPEDD